MKLTLSDQAVKRISKQVKEGQAFMDEGEDEEVLERGERFNEACKSFASKYAGEFQYELNYLNFEVSKSEAKDLLLSALLSYLNPGAL